MTRIRPYFKLGIADLESIFDAAHTDSAICQALIEELGHRSTERATALLKRIESEMAGAAIGGNVSAVAAREHLASPKAPWTPIPPTAPAAVPASSSVAIPRHGLHARPVVIDKPNVLPTARPAKEQPAPANAPRREFPAEENKPSSILAAWTALEALSPQTYRRPADLANGDGRCVAQISDDGLPWVREERSRPKQQLYYQVILGSVHMDRATDALIKAFGEDEERGRKEKEKAALAAILLDRNGILLEENSVAVSSFGWALPIALTGKLEGFQGKEAEAVIAVLGAPMSVQQGARRWAASTLNIFNVMVSRAKQTIYVVGSRSAWATVGHGRSVAGSLPPKT
jgi:hypothetical protein